MQADASKELYICEEYVKAATKGVVRVLHYATNLTFYLIVTRGTPSVLPLPGNPHSN